MVSMTGSTVSGSTRASDHQLSTIRMWVLRATYLLLVVGLGAMILPPILDHELTSRGVIQSLLGAVWLLALFGLRYPLQMLPVLLFEFAWKLIWTIAYGLPQWSAGQLPPTFAEDSFAIGVGVILMPLVIPWGYVWRHYVKAPAERFTAAAPNASR